MLRSLPVAGLLVGWAVLAAAPPALAQQIRQFKQITPPAPTPLQNNFNNPMAPQGPGLGALNFNVLNPGNQAAVNNNNNQNPAINNANNLINGNNPLAGQNALNPYAINNAFNTAPFNAYGAVNPYALNSALNPGAYNTMMYGNPYGNMAMMNPYAAYANPYMFMNTGMPIAGTAPMGQGPSAATLYNFNMNYAYLSNPYINPMSNPAFSGPFPPGIFNTTAALSILGFMNPMQNLPLNPAQIPGAGTGNGNNNSPFP